MLSDCKKNLSHKEIAIKFDMQTFHEKHCDGDRKIACALNAKRILLTKKLLTKFDMKTFREKHCYCESKIVCALIAQSAHKEIANKT